MDDLIELPSCENHGLGIEVGEVMISDAAGVELPIDNDEIEEGQLVLNTTMDMIQQPTDLHLNSPELNGNAGTPLILRQASETESSSKSGTKRSRMTSDEQQPSVHVKYYCLSRQSRQKLEELLRQWSEWHVQNPSEILDRNGGLETGEGIYFPALDIGTEKTSAVSFWMENETRKPENDDFLPVEEGSVPLYDRGFILGSADGVSNLEGDIELLDAPRCFNCGSYNHALKECPKPRNNAAVNNSRKQLKLKRNQTAGVRNASRYYQDSPGGKYEGLRPGLLDAETRRLLGLGEFDPPPWLNRMRDIGYPPGYLEPEDGDLPSGIIIYADEVIKDDKEDGEILEAEQVNPPRKMSVMFPGINAPIPKNADERVWTAGSSSEDCNQTGDFNSNHSSESNSRGRNREHNYRRDYKNDDVYGSERTSRYPPRYSEHEYSSPSHSLRRNASGSRSPNAGRFMVDRGRSDPLDSENSIVSRLYSSFSYNSSRSISEHSNDLEGGMDRDDRYRNRRGQ